MGRGWGGRGQYQVCDQGAVATITRSTSLVTTNSRNTGIVIPDLIQTILSEADRPGSTNSTPSTGESTETRASCNCFKKSFIFVCFSNPDNIYVIGFHSRDDEKDLAFRNILLVSFKLTKNRRSGILTLTILCLKLDMYPDNSFTVQEKSMRSAVV